MSAVKSADDRWVAGRRGWGPATWVGPAIVAVILLAVVSDGLLFWPFVIGSLTVLAMSRRRARAHFRRRGPVHGQVWWSGRGNDPLPRYPAVRSPFEKPAFWDAQPAPANQLTASQPRTPGMRTPPAWDPLGAAPFAWDLPEPPPLRQPRAARHPAGTAALTAGAVLLTAALITVGDFAGWWPR